MRVNTIEVVGVTCVIDIDTGKTSNTLPGLKHVEKVTKDGRDYYVISGTRLGATVTFWEQLANTYAVFFHMVAEGGDPCYNSFPLPITTSVQAGANKLPIAHLIKGVVYCEKCSLSRSLTYPDAIALYPKNILPMDQDCHCCGQMLVQIGRKPNIMITKYIKPEKK